MKYKLIQMIDGMMVASEFDEANVIAAMDARGFKVVGWNQNPHQRVELQARPIFEGVVGPMFDGGFIRYEDGASNNALSL